MRVYVPKPGEEGHDIPGLNISFLGIINWRSPGTPHLKLYSLHDQGYSFDSLFIDTESVM